jgi:dephospho-CoA kinase
MPGARTIVGLTGGIGCGKSTVANVFLERGVAMIDTDAFAHELTAANGRAMPLIVREFGESMLSADGSLDRRAMRARVFASPAARAVLESILHPMIREEVDTALEGVGATAAPYTMLVVPLMFETMTYRFRLWRTLVVDCPVASQVSRVAKRPGVDCVEAQRIVESQIRRPYRLQLADDLLYNDGEVASVAPKVDFLHERYLALLATM